MLIQCGMTFSLHARRGRTYSCGHAHTHTHTDPLAPRAALAADVTLPVPRGSPPQEDVHAAATAAVMYFCGMCGAGAAEGAARIAIEMAPVEREQLVLKHARSLASEQIAVRPARAWNAKRRRNRAPPHSCSPCARPASPEVL